LASRFARRSVLDFSDKLLGAWESSGAALCVGLDPILERIPAAIARGPRPVLAFNKLVIDTVGDLVCAFKPQHAHHAAVGAEDDLADTIAYIHERWPKVVALLDAKRGDIGSTAEMYAREAFDRYDADAVTVNPYLGDEGVLPFMDRPDRGAVVLCRTSNPGADRVQKALVDGEPLYLTVARRAERVWNRLNNVMLVVGGTHVDDLARVRAAAPNLAFLVPGIGEQGGSARDAARAGRRADGHGLVVSASRSVLYAGSQDQIRHAAEAVFNDLTYGSSEVSGRLEAIGETAATL
jgi:orotidine-5'-phosphate decarboxylase